MGWEKVLSIFKDIIFVEQAELQKEKERENVCVGSGSRARSSIYWFTQQVASMARAGLVKV